ncbi:hypothetical protein [Persephonella sp.]
MIICYDPAKGNICDFENLKRKIKNIDISLENSDFTCEIQLDGGYKFIFSCFYEDNTGSISVYRGLNSDFVDLQQVFTVFLNFGEKKVKNLYLKRVWDYVEEKIFLKYGKILSDLNPPFVIIYRHKGFFSLPEKISDEILEISLSLTSKMEEKMKK